jgi:hypothetical protein
MTDYTNEYGTPDFDITPAPAESNHPVLTQLHEKISGLELELESTKTLMDNHRTRSWELSSNFANYKYKLANVLRTFAQEDPDNVELCVKIADEMDIELLNSKDFEISVTFNVTVTAPFGEEIELSEYDVDATLDLSGYEFELNDTSVNSVDED